MDTVKLSICCIAYNHEAYIRQCLDGFLMQKTNFAFEIVVHDDASSDKTQEIIREYKAKYPDIIRPIYQAVNQYSQGINPFIEFVVPESRGKYIAVCEGDDYWIDSHKLQKQVDFMEAHPDYSMCFHNAVVVHEYETEDGDLFAHLKKGEYSAKNIISRLSVPTASAVFRKEILGKRPENKNYQVGDNVLWLTCLRCGRIYCLNDQMSVYRKVNTGWVKSNENILPYKIITHTLALKESFPEINANIFVDVIVEQYVNLTKYYLRKFDVRLFRVFVHGVANYPYKYATMFIFSVISRITKIFKKETN